MSIALINTGAKVNPIKVKPIKAIPTENNTFAIIYSPLMYEIATAIAINAKPGKE